MSEQETEKLYDEDAYWTDFYAQVLSCGQEGERFSVVLDQTAFFPEAGGQTPDRGVLRFGGEEARVLDVQIDDASGIITHTLDRAIPTGSVVMGAVDWTHRFDNMQQHTGEHIFSGLVCGRFHCNNVGFHLSDQTVTMDYDRALSAEELAAVEASANEAIWRNLPVEISFPADEALAALAYRSKKELAGRIRIVTIPGVDVCACCAPHVRHTGEIGVLKVLAAQSYKGGVRVAIVCGKRALVHLTREHELLTGMARAFSTAPEGVPAHVTRLEEELGEAKRVTGELGERFLSQQLDLLTDDIITNDTITDDKEHVILFESAVDTGAARRALNRWAEDHAGLCGIFLGDDATGYQYLIGAGKRTEDGHDGSDAPADARVLSGRLVEALGAKGGGSSEMVQGRVQATAAAIREALGA